MQREKEEELIFRGRQYAEAIRMNPGLPQARKGLARVSARRRRHA